MTLRNFQEKQAAPLRVLLGFWEPETNEPKYEGQPIVAPDNQADRPLTGTIYGEPVIQGIKPGDAIVRWLDAAPGTNPYSVLAPDDALARFEPVPVEPEHVATKAKALGKPTASARGVIDGKE